MPKLTSNEHQNILGVGPVHEAMIRFNEMERYVAEFSAAIESRHPGVPFALAMRPSSNLLLDMAGDREMVAYTLPAF